MLGRYVQYRANWFGTPASVPANGDRISSGGDK